MMDERRVFISELNVVEKNIGNFITAIEDAQKQRNAYAALTVTVTLPDICCRLDGSKVDKGSRKPYIDWFNKYVTAYNIQLTGIDPIIFNNGENAYALRCAFLHDGDGNISNQSASDKALGIDNIHFFFSDKPNVSAANITITEMAIENGRELLLNVDDYCEFVIQGVWNWIAEYKDDPQVQSRAEGMIKIKPLSKYK